MAARRDRNSSSNQPSDRRMRGRGSEPSRRSQPTDRRMQRPNDPGTRRRRRLALIVGGVMLLAMGGVAFAGVYLAFIAPDQVPAARVGEMVYTQGDLVKRIRMLKVDSAASGQEFAVGTSPFEVLQEMYEAGLARRGAPRYGIRVTDADVEAYLKLRFSPGGDPTQGSSDPEVEREYRDNYVRFLDDRHLSEGDYRELIEERIFMVRLREKLGEQIPALGEQVEVHWIKLPSASEIDPADPNPINATEFAVERLEEEPFEEVAGRISRDSIYSDSSGYVGWVPRGAFPELDKYFFGDEEDDPLAHNEISEPVATPEGTYIVKVTAGPEDREISDQMRERLKDQALVSWLREEQSRGSDEGWFELNWNSKLYDYVNEQVREFSPAGGSQQR